MKKYKVNTDTIEIFGLSCTHYEAMIILQDAGRFGYPSKVNNSDPVTVEHHDRIEYANDILLDLDFDERMTIAEGLSKQIESDFQIVEFNPVSKMNLVA